MKYRTGLRSIGGRFAWPCYANRRFDVSPLPSIATRHGVDVVPPKTSLAVHESNADAGFVGETIESPDMSFTRHARHMGVDGMSRV